MTAKLILTKGLPASGKSTWARDFVRTSNKRIGPATRRVSRDDIRRMLGNYDDFSQAREAIVSRIEREAVKAILAHGDTTIVDNCHLNPMYEREWREFVAPLEVPVEIRYFTDVPLRECLKRNAGRDQIERVPNKVIHDMYNAWLAPRTRERDFNLPDALIVDMDGTLAIIGKRSPYDASKCDLTDHLNNPVWDMVSRYLNNHELIIMSGREDKDRPATLRWLRNNGINPSGLHMRTTGDHRPDTVVKKELFKRHIEGRYNVALAVDDRDAVVDLWRSMGITTMQVGEGWF